jgi:hypothetical protein
MMMMIMVMKTTTMMITTTMMMMIMETCNAHVPQRILKVYKSFGEKTPEEQSFAI